MTEVRQDDDAALIEFLSSLMEYSPAVPDELAEHYLARSGFQCPDVRIVRMIAVATQKFIAEIANDSLQLCKARQGSMSKEKRDKQKDKGYVLTTEDLSMALREYGVNLKRQEYFADNISAGLNPTSKDD